MLSLLQTILATHLNCDALDALQLWKVKHIDEKTTERIKIEIKAVNTYAVVNIIFALLAGTMYILSENLGKMCFPLAIIENYVPSWKDELSFLYRTSYILAALAMMAN